VTQGGTATCYIIAGLATLAHKHPNMVKDMFFNDQNDNGIYAVRFFIRGKPWLITIDDTVMFKDGNAPAPYFAHVN
jgi:hypothetical protein